jgi:hypothetical protein
LEGQKAIESKELDPWSLFIFAMKAPMTKDRYKAVITIAQSHVKRLGAFFEEKPVENGILLEMRRLHDPTKEAIDT